MKLPKIKINDEKTEQKLKKAISKINKVRTTKNNKIVKKISCCVYAHWFILIKLIFTGFSLHALILT